VPRSCHAVALALLVTLTGAATAGAVTAQDIPVSALRSIADSYSPGVRLPTVFPKSVTAVNVGFTSGIGGGPPPRYQLTYHTSTVSVFQLAVWPGDKKAAVLKGLVKHDGAHGSSRAFRAGSIAGTLEVQNNTFTKPKMWIASYVWFSSGFTYALMVREKPGGQPLYPGLKPLATIASFKA